MIKSSSSTIVQTKPEPQSPTLPQDSNVRKAMPPASSLPSRISGHDLMAIFPTNPPPHTISCDDLFKKQAHQFLSRPEHPVAAAPSMGSSQSRRESPPEGAVNSHGWHRDTAPPNPHQPSLGPGHGNIGTEPKSRTWSRPNTSASGHNTPSPGSHQETRRSEGGSSRGSSERRTKHSSESASPMPLFTRQPLSLDRSRTSQ